MFATVGCDAPACQAVRNQPCGVCVTLKLSDNAEIPLGIPVQGPAGTVNVRVCPEPKIGPPNGPGALRVSTTRQGVTDTKTRGLLRSAFAFGWNLCEEPVAGTGQFTRAPTPSANAPQEPTHQITTMPNKPPP